MNQLTENEIVEESRANLSLIESGILKEKYTLEEISEILPGIIHINSLDDFAINYINTYGENKYDKPKEEIIGEGTQFLEEIFEPGTLEYFAQPLIQMVQENDRSKVISFFQKVRTNKNSGFEWLLTTSKIIKGKNESISISQEVSGMDSSIKAISKLLDDNLFLRKNMNKFSSLTKREKQVMKMVASGLSTRQVAEQLFLSPQTVKTHRKNISSKLELSRVIEWEYFANAFDL